ncbi:MAG TPA: hypothetical protein VFL86_15515 [Burkholderiaceae bacterium]|nr:hypothetical protein [Burkholderiaceae bacterium]
MTQALPQAMQDHGVPFDVFIQALTLQLDKAQAAMALKARVGKLPMTFAVKDVSLDLRAFVQMVNDDVWLRPAGPGDANASTIKLALTTVTKPMIDENAVSFHAEDPKFSIRDALGGAVSEEEQRGLERIGVHTIQQLQELRSAAGADVVARLARMPVNRLQQAMLAASAPRVTRVVAGPATPDSPTQTPVQVHLQAPAQRPGSSVPLVRVRGQLVPVAQGEGSQLVLQPLAEQMGAEAEIEFGDGQRATIALREGSLGRWHGDPDQEHDPESQP